MWSWVRYKNPVESSHKRLKKEDALICLRKLNISTIEVIGDSQGRSVYHILKSRLGTESESDSAFKIKTKKETKIGEVNLSYVPDYFLQFNSTDVRKSNLVLTGTGPHPGSWGQWTFAKFESQMHQIAKDLCSRTSPTIWFGSPAWPKGKPSSEKNFRVTNPRMEIFNQLARRVLVQTCPGKILFLEFFHMTISQIKLSPDGAHYHKTVVLDAVVDEIIELLCEQ